MTDALITTVPFGQLSREPFDLMEQAGLRYVVNPIGRRLTENELIRLIPDFDVLIAGTEPITARVIAAAPRLRFISRVGIGLDSVDLLAARARQIGVAYTPDAPSPAVAELTVGLMLSLLRGVHTANALAHVGDWRRVMGRRLGEITVGVVGVGRVGSRVIRLAHAFGARILANDVAPREVDEPIEWTSKERIFREAEIVTLHVPLTPLTRHIVGAAELEMMRPTAFLVNTARGGIVDETALAAALRTQRIAGAGVDVFCHDPYTGELAGLDNCLITCHMGSMSEDCRFQMECEAVGNAVRFVRGQPVSQLVPESEYLLRSGTPASQAPP